MRKREPIGDFWCERPGTCCLSRWGEGAVFSTLVFDGAHNILDVVKTGSGYTVRFNGVLLGTADSEALPYYGSLLVGAERNFDLEPFRQSNLTVWSLTVE